MRQSHIRFMVQQGFEVADAGEGLYAALMVQPRFIGSLVVLGVLLHNAGFFLVLSAVLWWSTLVPTLNPFDTLANHLVAQPRGLPPLRSAPGPRRFAQGLSATVTFAIGAALLLGAEWAVWPFEGLMVAAVVAVVFGDFCEGAYLYNVMRGRTRRPAGSRPRG